MHQRLLIVFFNLFLLYQPVLQSSIPTHDSTPCKLVEADSYGRILRGKKPADFEWLSDDPQRKIVFLMDSHALLNLRDKTGYEMLIALGYLPDYLKNKVIEGTQFKLLVFRGNGQAQLATWDNTLQIVGQVYPELAADLKRHTTALKTTSFKTIEETLGYKLVEVEKIGKEDPRFMTFHRYLESKRTLADMRAFLYFTVQLRELFSGDGYTYDCNGKRGIKEYIVINKKLKDLDNYLLIEVPVNAP